MSDQLIPDYGTNFNMTLATMTESTGEPEAMAARGGLGLLMIRAHTQSDTVIGGIAVGVITIALLVFFSSSLTLIVGTSIPQVLKQQ